MKKRSWAATTLAKALVVVICLLLVWEMVSIYDSMRSIDRNLDAIETQLAPNGPIDDSLSSIETKIAPGGGIDANLSAIETQLALTPTP